MIFSALKYDHPVKKCLQNPMSGPFHRLIKICIVENDTRTLASQFQRYVFEITLRGSLQDFSSRDGASGKGNLVDEWMMADCVAYGWAWIHNIRNEVADGQNHSPYPLMMLTTPGGMPASLSKPANFNAVRGVISEGCRRLMSIRIDIWQ
jgi:hypothetical protein